jgi:uncharacterized protein YjgD (DUF1641 family)
MSEVSLRNEPQDEMARLMLGAREALTDSMVERLSVSAANALEVLDRLNDEDVRAAVTNGLDRLAEMQRIGALDTLFDFVGLLHAARSASTDNIVERLFAFAEHMVNTVGSEEAATLVMDAEGALGEAAEEVSRQPPGGGVLATLSLLAKPESQRSLAFLLAFGEKLLARSTAPPRA